MTTASPQPRLSLRAARQRLRALIVLTALTGVVAGVSALAAVFPAEIHDRILLRQARLDAELRYYDVALKNLLEGSQTLAADPEWQALLFHSVGAQHDLVMTRNIAFELLRQGKNPSIPWLWDGWCAAVCTQAPDAAASLREALERPENLERMTESRRAVLRGWHERIAGREAQAEAAFQEAAALGAAPEQLDMLRESPLPGMLAARETPSNGQVPLCAPTTEETP